MTQFSMVNKTYRFFIDWFYSSVIYSSNHPILFTTKTKETQKIENEQKLFRITISEWIPRAKSKVERCTLKICGSLWKFNANRPTTATNIIDNVLTLQFLCKLISNWKLERRDTISEQQPRHQQPLTFCHFKKKYCQTFYLFLIATKNKYATWKFANFTSVLVQIQAIVIKTDTQI